MNSVRNDFTDVLVKRGITLRSALGSLDQTGTGFLIAVDVDGKLSGVLTDGDIRRALLQKHSLDEPIECAMRNKCVSLPVEASAVEIEAVFTDGISFVPLVDGEGRPVDYAGRRRHRRYPVMEPLLDGNEAEYLQECVQSGWISSKGRFVGLFEQMMADFHGVPHALAVSNGTVALHLALISMGIGPGDEVIVPDLTFAASANSVLHAGATPVFVDIDPETWNINTHTIERALTDRTRAIMPVHLYGHPCDMDGIMTLAQERNLLVIEDCAEALGARYKGRLVGTFGDAACYSFFGNKTLTTGEGGIVLFRESKTFDRAHMLRDHGMSKERRYWHLEVGYNYRLTNLQAAIGVAQMERVESILVRKREVARQYGEALMGFPWISLPPCAHWADPVYWLYTIQLTDDSKIFRDDLADRLLLNGIETRPVFYPLHQMPPYQNIKGNSEYAVSEKISRAGLSLPSAITMRDEDVNIVATKIKAILDVRQMAAVAHPMG